LINPITGKELQYNLPRENWELQNENSLRIRHKKLLNYQDDSAMPSSGYFMLPSQNPARSARNGSTPLEELSLAATDPNQTHNNVGVRIKSAIKLDRRMNGRSYLPDIAGPLMDTAWMGKELDQSKMEKNLRELMEANAALQAKVSRLSEHMQTDREIIQRLEGTTRRLTTAVFEGDWASHHGGKPSAKVHNYLNQSLLTAQESTRNENLSAVSTEKVQKMWKKIKEIQENQSRMSGSVPEDMDRIVANLESKIERCHASLRQDRERLVSVQAFQERLAEKVDHLGDERRHEKEKNEQKLKPLEAKMADVDRLAAEIQGIGKVIRVDMAHNIQRISDSLGQLGTKLAVSEVR